MSVKFEDLASSDLIVNEVYLGGKESGKGSEVISKLVPGISNSGGFRIKRDAKADEDLMAILYADNKHDEWINTYNSKKSKFIYYGDNKDVEVSIEDSTKRGMGFLNRTNKKLANNSRKNIPPIFVFVKGGNGWDVRFIGIAVPGFKDKDHKSNFLEKVSYEQEDGIVYNYKSTYTILNVRKISREWLNDINKKQAYVSEFAPQVWKEWVDTGEAQPLIGNVDSFGLESSTDNRTGSLVKNEMIVSNKVKENSVLISEIDNVVLIKINRTYYEGMPSNELYKATSVSWVAKFDKTETRDLRYYCAVYQNKIVEVYDLNSFVEELPKRTPSRYILQGEIAQEEIRDQLIGIDVSKIHKGSGNPIKYTSVNKLLNNVGDEDDVMIQNVDSNVLINHIHTYISSKGFNYTQENIKNLYLSLRAKPFVIISGISGTGKTKIVQLLAESIGATEDNGQFRLVPVRPDWSDSSDLIGYEKLSGEYVDGHLTKIIKQANGNPNRPHFLLLDEMNLARVEYYFSDVLSVMESRSFEDGELTSSTINPDREQEERVTLPGNLYVIGTVNMDETTHPFSKKVLDRANTLEFNDIDLMNLPNTALNVVEPIAIGNEALQSKYIHLIDLMNPGTEALVNEVAGILVEMNKILTPIHTQVGYRVRDEICFYMAYNAEDELLTTDEALDFCIMQKILPRITGAGNRLDTALKALQMLLGSTYPRSEKKIAEMIERLGEDGFTSFWIA